MRTALKERSHEHHDSSRDADDILTDDGPGTGVGPVAHGHRRDEHVVGAGAAVAADRAARLVDPVVVDEDARRSDVGVLTDRGVPDIGQVRHLGPGADLGVLGLDEGADLALGAEVGARAKVGEGPDRGSGADDGREPMRAYDGRAVADLDIGERGVGSEDDVVTDGAGTVDLGLRVDRHVAAERDVSVDPRRGRVDDGHSGAHPALDDAAVELGTEPRQLDAVVDTLGLPHVLDQMRAHPKAFGANDPQDVGEVLLALRVVRAHLGQRLAQDQGVERVQAGVDLGDLQLLGGGVLLLNDAGDRAVCRANDAAIAEWVGQRGGDHRGGAPAGSVRVEQSTQGLSSEQVHVATGHQHRSLEVSGQRVECTLGGPTRAHDLVLVGDDRIGVDRGDVGGDEIASVTDHDGQMLGVCAARGTNPQHLAVVIRHGRDLVAARIATDDADAVIAVQDEVMGTGRATECALDALPADLEGTVLVTYGDVPLLTAETLRGLFEAHTASGSAATVITATLPDPFGYGRIIRAADGSVAGIVEQKDATAEQLEITEINSGLYAFDALVLRK